MKLNKNLAIIVAVVFLSAVVSLVVSKALFGASKKNLQYEVVQKVTPDFIPQKDTDEYKANFAPIFNDQAIDPTQLIKIGDGSNPQPF